MGPGTCGYYMIIFIVICVYAQNNNKNLAYRQYRFEVLYVNKSLVEVSGSIYFYNRTTKALRLQMLYKHKIPDSAILDVNIYKWINANWVKFAPAALTVTVKTMLTVDIFNSLELVHSCNLSWPIIPQHRYDIKDYVPDIGYAPANLITGRYKGHLFMYESSRRRIKYAQIEYCTDLIEVFKW